MSDLSVTPRQIEDQMSLIPTKEEELEMLEQKMVRYDTELIRLLKKENAQLKEKLKRLINLNARTLVCENMVCPEEGKQRDEDPTLCHTCIKLMIDYENK